MFGREHGYVPPEAQEFKAPEIRQTPERVRKLIDSVLGAIFNEFKVEGKDALIRDQEKNPDARYIIAGSHFSGHDVQSTIKALGDRLDIQVTGETLVEKMLIPKAQILAMGKDRFSSISYKNVKGEHVGVFQPKDFDPIADHIKQGRAPWMAIHPFSMDKEMRDAGIGVAYLAHKTGAKVLPTTVNVEGASTRFITPPDWLEQAKGKLRGTAKATYRIAEPIALPELDVSVIERVMSKRAARRDGGAGEEVTSEERQEFLKVSQQLRAEAEMIAEQIAAMVPEEQRGAYAAQEAEDEQE